MARLPHPLVLAALALATAPAAFAGPPAPTALQAQIGIQPLGAIHGTRDGTAQDWAATIYHGRSQSLFHGATDGTNVTIYGRESKGPGRISIDMVVSGLGTAHPKAKTFEVRMLDKGWIRGNFASANGGSAKVTLTGAGMDGDMLHVAGQFSAVMPYRFTNKRAPEPGRVSRLTDGRFDVWVLPEPD